MTWRPIKPDHSIERVRVLCRFADNFPSRFLRKLAADGESRRAELGFTSKNLRQGQRLTLSPGKVDMGVEPGDLLGWDWQKLSPTSMPIEIFLVELDRIVYETADYTRWADFWDRFWSVVYPTMEQAADFVGLASISLEYVDRFIYDGPQFEADPKSLVPTIAAQLPDSASSGSELWHLHKGWFEGDATDRLLINLNIDAQDGHDADDALHRSVQIFSKVELRVGSGEFDLGNLKYHLDIMHDRSIECFKTVVSEQMQARVGMGGDNNG